MKGIKHTINRQCGLLYTILSLILYFVNFTILNKAVYEHLCVETFSLFGIIFSGCISRNEPEYIEHF